MTRSANAGSRGNYMFPVPTIEGLLHFRLLPTIYRVPIFSPCLPTLGMRFFFFFGGHSNTCVTSCVTSHCGDKLHFVNNYGLWTLFPVFICHPYILHGKIYVLLVFLTELCFSLTTGNKEFWSFTLLTQYFSEWSFIFLWNPVHPLFLFYGSWFGCHI